ncbi:MAG: hypothetical protein WBA29_15345 [Xanthobacteraceae bacterium]
MTTAVIGPAGLMVAEVLTQGGVGVTVFDAIVVVATCFRDGMDAGGPFECL